MNLNATYSDLSRGFSTHTCPFKVFPYSEVLINSKPECSNLLDAALFYNFECLAVDYSCGNRIFTYLSEVIIEYYCHLNGLLATLRRSPLVPKLRTP